MLTSSNEIIVTKIMKFNSKRPPDIYIDCINLLTKMTFIDPNQHINIIIFFHKICFTWH
jgi:hypothetical protein